MARTTTVAVVGLGSRGLSVLERIVTLAKKAGPAAGEVRVEIIDPTCTGAGIHAPGQPDYLLLNTTCAQVSMFPDAHTVGAAVDAPGPSLYEWAISRGLRLDADGFSVGQHGRAIRPTDFLPRRLLGEYLAWFFDQVRERAPEHVRLVVHRSTAVELSATPDGGLAIGLADGTRVAVRYAYLTTGYTPNAGPDPALPGAHRLIPEPYVLPDRVAVVDPGRSVAINGFGLSTMDLMSCLTVGRGGRFVENGDQHWYLPSGREPTILMYSRSGVPCRARPLVTRFEAPYEPLVLTRASIDALRDARGGPLDFDADVLPLIHTELRIAYRRCQARLAGGDAEPALLRELAGQRIGGVLDDLDRRLDPFDAPATFAGSAGMLLDDSAAYQKWLSDLVRRDLAEGVLGFAGSPVKAALDILRDLRDTIRYIVDYGGLTERSLDEFTLRTVPLMNRAVVGPQYERHSELLALMAAGIVQVPFGPAPDVAWDDRAGRWTIASTQLAVPHVREVDWLVHGYVPAPAVESSASPLIAALYRDGWLRPHRPASRHVHGVDVDAQHHPLDRAGRSDQRLWVLGPLCEGAVFYTNLVPSPDTYSRPLFDAHRIVAEMFAAGSGRLTS